MTVRLTPHLDTRIALLLTLVVGLASASAGVAQQPQQSPATGATEIRTVSAQAQPCVNLRESPSYQARIVGCIEAGSVVVVSGAQDGWSRVSSESEGDGWVGTRLLNPPSGSSTAVGVTPPQAAQESSGEARQRRGAALERLSTERDSLAAQLADARGRIATLENELTRLTLANDDATALEASQTETERLRAQLTASEDRAAELEAELASTRAAWGSAAQEQGSLAERVAELTAERDSLARDLARAEARQLYLQSDLETTRAELMQLKGIPQRLVTPEPEPAARVLPPAAPEPTALEESVESATATEPLAEPSPDLYRTEEVVATVRAWAQAWSAQRVEDYLAFYAPGFQPADGQDRSSWELSRRERVAAPRSVDVTLNRLSPSVSSDRAVVLFEQTYASDQFTDVVSKTLVLDLVDGLWLIVQERVND